MALHWLLSFYTLIWWGFVICQVIFGIKVRKSGKQPLKNFCFDIENTFGNDLHCDACISGKDKGNSNDDSVITFEYNFL